LWSFVVNERKLGATLSLFSLEREFNRRDAKENQEVPVKTGFTESDKR
jgi:hypothetical protein